MAKIKHKIRNYSVLNISNWYFFGRFLQIQSHLLINYAVLSYYVATYTQLLTIIIKYGNGNRLIDKHEMITFARKYNS